MAKGLFELFDEFLEGREPQSPCQENRVPLCVAPETRARLRALLTTDSYKRMGYTDFLNCAIALAEVSPQIFLSQRKKHG